MGDFGTFSNYSKSLTVLYVEDNEDTRTLAISILQDFFGKIVEAVDGQDGFEKFLTNDIDLVITDINMPKVNGLEMAKMIRNKKGSMPIVALSAHSDVAYFMEAIELGIDGYILKPIDMNQAFVTLNRIIERIKAQDEREKYYNLLIQYQDAIDKSEMVVKFDEKGNINYVNDKFCHISGYTKIEAENGKHNILKHPDVPYYFYDNILKNLQKDSVWQGILRHLTKDGKNYYTKVTIKSIKDSDGNLLEYMLIGRDITDIMNSTKQLQDLVDSSQKPLVAFIKIENFTNIGKLYGHGFVQKLEKKANDIFLHFMPKEYEFERLFTLGAGEFALFIDMSKSNKDIGLIRRGLYEFQRFVDESVIEIDGIENSIYVILSFAYGVNSIEDARLGLEKLIKEKKEFIDATGQFESQKETVKNNINTIEIIKKALKEKRVVSYFQPIVNSKTQKIEEYESLVRLIDDNGTILPPCYFLDIAKQSKYYHQITMSVLKNSFDALDKTDKDISINISVIDIETDFIRDAILEFLDKFGGERVVFELLEDEALDDFEIIKYFIESVKKKGVRIAIDDFGSGYSNFKRLLELQPDILKIDASLIKNIESDKFSFDVTKTIVEFAKSQNIKTTAEYVENENIYKILLNLGVDYSQGYYFGKPDVL